MTDALDTTTVALGKPTQYQSEYNPALLYTIPRRRQRAALNLGAPLPFYGVDIWNAYELSWLDQRGKPQVAIAVIRVPCDSPELLESKALKLYTMSFHNSRFSSWDQVARRIQADLSNAVQAGVKVALTPVDDFAGQRIEKMQGTCLDDLEISIDDFFIDTSLLTTQKNTVTETVYSNLLKSNCLVTAQPDLASVQISYTGKQIDHAGLLKYLVGSRNTLEFHEQCVERIFVDIMYRCQPDQLSVYARYTRRGGLDINPWRSTEKGELPGNGRLARQ